MKLLVLAGLVTAFALGSAASAPDAFPVVAPALAARPAGARPAADPASPLPATLADTGLFAPGSTEIATANLSFSPQYPLWTDGLRKRRWLSLPPGTFIDASDPDVWQFPPGTRLWKEFGAERPVETRFVERLADGTWRFASYLWNAQGTEARLAPEDGVRVDVPGLPGRSHAVPSRADCLACHDGGAGPVLGLSALQLSADRDPRAPHADPAQRAALDLRAWVERGLLRNLPAALLDAPPRIAAASPTARAALGYLHGNCGHCHNDAGPLATLDLSLAQSAADPAHSARRTLDSLLGHASRFRAQGSSAAARVVPGRVQASVLAERMQSTNPFARMPPLGVQVIDAEGLALVERWIEHGIRRDPNPPDLGARSEQASLPSLHP
jgi:hypothetical protein